MLPSKMTPNNGAPASLQCCSVGSAKIELQLHGCAQLELEEGTLRCQTLLYAKILDASHEDLKKLIFNEDINLPSSSQIWSKPMSIEIKGKYFIKFLKSKFFRYFFSDYFRFSNVFQFSKYFFYFVEIFEKI